MLSFVTVTKSILSVTEVACLLNTSTFPIYKLIKEGKLKIIPGGKSYKITAQSVQDYINSKAIKK